jgi:hypothetical protein
MYIDNYRPWPAWVVEGNEEIARKFHAQIGTYRGHADRDPGHDMSGDLAADFFLYDNTKAQHDAVLAWFKNNAVRIGATYIITWRRIWSVARASEGVRVYSGSDPHIGHFHVSYGTTPPEEDMPTAKEIAHELANNKEFLAAVGKAVADADEVPNAWGDPSVNPNVRIKSSLAEIGKDTAEILKKLP